MPLDAFEGGHCFVFCLGQEDGEAHGMAHPDLLDPITDLKLNQLDIVDAVRERQALLQVTFS
jgi:hypothetical protein